MQSWTILFRNYRISTSISYCLYGGQVFFFFLVSVSILLQGKGCLFVFFCDRAYKVFIFEEQLLWEKVACLYSCEKLWNICDLSLRFSTAILALWQRLSFWPRDLATLPCVCFLYRENDRLSTCHHFFFFFSPPLFPRKRVQSWLWCTAGSEPVSSGLTVRRTAGVDGRSPAGGRAKRQNASGPPCVFWASRKRKPKCRPSVDSVAPRTHTTPIPSLWFSVTFCCRPRSPSNECWTMFFYFPCTCGR